MRMASLELLRHQEVALDLRRESVAAHEEGVEEIVETAGHDLVDAAEIEARVNLAGEALAFARPRAAERRERVQHLLEAIEQRAPHIGVEDQELGDLLRIDRVAKSLAIGAERADRAQQRAPLELVDRLAVHALLGQELVILDVEDARRVVAALHEGAEADEVER